MQTTGLTGDFVLPKDTKKKLLFIAGGIGITPFVSMLQAAKREGRDITVLYFVRNQKEAAYQTILDQSGADIHYFSAEPADERFIHAATLTDTVLQDWVTRTKERTAYISGPPVMVTAAKKLLKTRVAGIRTDYFSGY